MNSNAEPGDIPPFDRTSGEYLRLVAAVAKGAVLFVGAGSSCRIGYPSWYQLLNSLRDAIETPGNYPELGDLEGVDGPVRASEYRKSLGEQRYRQVLQGSFAPREPQHDGFHEKLVDLPFRHVFTTNYDYVLESAHACIHSVDARHFDIDEWARLSDLWKSHTATDRQRCYVHVHGSIDRLDGIVLCQEDYDARYMHETRAKNFLKDLLTGNRVVFVGYSLSDFDLDYILREVAASLGISQPRHFILLPDPASPEERSKTRINNNRLYHIEPVFYDNSVGDHRSLVALIDSLKEDVAAELNRDGRKRYIEINAVQSLVETLIEGQPERRDNIETQLIGFIQQHAVSLNLQDTSGGTTDIDAEITEAFELIRRGLPADAIDKYEAIRGKYTERLTARHRYRLAANIGHAFYAQGKHDESARAYLEATGHYRDSRDARALEVLGHVLLRDLQKALELAETLCADEPDFARARSLWIRAQPDDIDFDVVFASVSEGLRHDAEVALALAELARKCGDLATAEEHARQAVLAAPQWTDALSMVATLILSTETGKAAVNIDHGFVVASPDRVREAEQALSSEIEHTPDSDPSGSLGVAYFNRAGARRLVEDRDGAANDLATAFQHDSYNPTIACAFAVNAESDVERVKVLKVIEKLQGDIPERDQLLFARVFLLVERGRPEDIQRATTIVRDVASRLHEVTPASLRSDFVTMGLRVLATTDHGAECPLFVSSVPADAIPSYALAQFKGNAQLAAGHREEATEHARHAIEELRDDASWFERREIALLAENCGLHAPAMILWALVLEDSFFGTDMDHFMRCALVAGEWKQLLQACARLRDSGQLRRIHVLAEAHVLANSRETGRALSVLQHWLIAHPADKSARLRLSALAIQHRHLEFAELDEDKLPTIQEIEDAHEGAALVYVLRRAESPNRALEIAYDLYRRFPDSPVTHHTLITCVFDPSVNQLEIERPSVVGENTAVCIRRSTDRNTLRWVYVENGPEPAITRSEYCEAHELVKALWEKGVGDHLEFQGHEYEVVGVENKALRRVHEVMETFEENFPDIPLLRRFNLPTKPPPHESPGELLGEVYTELKKQAERREQLESMYTANQLPLTCFAVCMGRPVFDAVRYFAFEPSRVVRACTGDANDWMGTLKKIQGRQELVLDSTALASALILNLLHVLPRIGRRFVVPQAAIDEVREISLNAGNHKTSRHSIGFHQGRVVFHEASPEELAREVEALERVQRFVRDHCEVVGGEATLELAAERRGQLESMIGEAATDALALAKKRNAILWTDDLGIRALAASDEFHVRSAWTQAMMQSALSAGNIQPSDYDNCLCNLVRFRYAFTTLRACDVAMILRKAGWRAKNVLGSAVIRLVADVSLMTPRNCTIVGASLLLIWQQCRRRGLKRDIIVAILEEIGRERAQPLIAAVCSNPMPMFREKSVRPLKRMLRSWRGRDKEFRPGRMTRRGPIQ